MEIWIITDKEGKYIRAYRSQESAFKFWDKLRNKYVMFQSSAD